MGFHVSKKILSVSDVCFSTVGQAFLVSHCWFWKPSGNKHQNDASPCLAGSNVVAAVPNQFLSQLRIDVDLNVPKRNTNENVATLSVQVYWWKYSDEQCLYSLVFRQSCRNRQHFQLYQTIHWRDYLICGKHYLVNRTLLFTAVREEMPASLTATARSFLLWLRSASNFNTQ